VPLLSCRSCCLRSSCYHISNVFSYLIC
jgi:hypothetical protein